MPLVIVLYNQEEAECIGVLFSGVTCIMSQFHYRENPVLGHSYDFSLRIINYCEELNGSRKFIISNQLLRSGTSIGANIFEAQNAESKSDFIHKMKVAAKEIEETKYWLLLCTGSQNYPPTGTLSTELEILAKLVGKIITTSIRNKKSFL